MSAGVFTDLINKVNNSAALPAGFYVVLVFRLCYLMPYINDNQCNNLFETLETLAEIIKGNP